jgi:hypothetical protein
MISIGVCYANNSLIVAVSMLMLGFLRQPNLQADSILANTAMCHLAPYADYLDLDSLLYLKIKTFSLWFCKFFNYSIVYFIPISN